MLFILLFICIGFALLFKGGDFLVTGAAGIAQKKNIPAFIVGITLVAFGTSAPELFFNVISALHGNAEFALSNVSGSNLINICVGIGISAMIATLPITRKHFAKDLVFLFLGPVLIVVFILLSGKSALGLVHGLLLFVGFAVYIFLTKQELSRHNDLLPESARLHEDTSCKKEWGIFFLGGVMLYIGGEVIYRNALAIVERLQLSESIVGLTVIAVGTSIPDCAASIIAVVKNQKDIAIGQYPGEQYLQYISGAGRDRHRLWRPHFVQSQQSLRLYIGVRSLVPVCPGGGLPAVLWPGHGHPGPGLLSAVPGVAGAVFQLSIPPVDPRGGIR